MFFSFVRMNKAVFLMLMSTLSEGLETDVFKQWWYKYGLDEQFVIWIRMDRYTDSTDLFLEIYLKVNSQYSVSNGSFQCCL